MAHPWRICLGVLLLTGCLQASAPPPLATSDPLQSLDWVDLGALVYDETHDHADRELHTEVRRGLRLLNRSALSEDGKSLGEYTEADARHGLIAVAVVIGTGSTMRIVLLDEAKLPNLDVVTSFVAPGAYGDVKFDPVRRLLYVPYPMPTVPDGRAFSIWSIEDPRNPRRVGEAPGVGCHMLHPMIHQGQSYVWCAAIDGAHLYAIQATPTGWAGVPLLAAEPQGDYEAARYASYYQGLGSPRVWITRVHDMTFQEDPLTKKPILVTAHELQGIRIFDVSQPTLPIEISRWRGQGMEQPIDRIHTVGLAEIGGRRIGFGATETFNRVAPALYVVDFTELTNPRLLARWVPPGIERDMNLTYALHNFQVVGERLYIANFHGGLWVLDVSEPAGPDPIALSTPVWDTEYPRPGQQDLPGFRLDQNMYWDVLVVNGHVLVTDMSSGVEVLQVDGDPLGDPTHRGRF